MKLKCRKHSQGSNINVDSTLRTYVLLTSNNKVFSEVSTLRTNLIVNRNRMSKSRLGLNTEQLIKDLETALNFGLVS